MANKVIKTVTLSQHKASNNIEALEVFKSKVGNLYACNKATGEFVGGLADDVDFKGDLIVHTMLNEETKESWLFIANGTPSEVLAEL